MISRSTAARASRAASLRPVPAGYEALQQTVHLAGDATPEQLAEIHEIVKATSPNFFNITRAVPTNSRLVIG